MQEEAFDRLSLLPTLLPVYRQVLDELVKRGVNWVQIDELALALELPQAWCETYCDAYQALVGQAKPILNTHFNSIRYQLDIITVLPVQGLHVDLMAAIDDLTDLHRQLPVE